MLEMSDEGGQNLRGSYLFGLVPVSISTKSSMEMTLTSGKGISFSTLKCLSSVTIKSAEAATAQSTNLLSSGVGGDKVPEKVFVNV